MRLERRLHSLTYPTAWMRRKIPNINVDRSTPDDPSFNISGQFWP
jgi:hypothetical protein